MMFMLRPLQRQSWSATCEQCGVEFTSQMRELPRADNVQSEIVDRITHSSLLTMFFENLHKHAEEKHGAQP